MPAVVLKSKVFLLKDLTLVSIRPFLHHRAGRNTIPPQGIRGISQHFSFSFSQTDRLGNQPNYNQTPASKCSEIRDDLESSHHVKLNVPQPSSLIHWSDLASSSIVAPLLFRSSRYLLEAVALRYMISQPPSHRTGHLLTTGRLLLGGRSNLLNGLHGLCNRIHNRHKGFTV